MSESEPLRPEDVRYLRHVLGWSQERLGDVLGRDKATISRWESGERDVDPLAADILRGLWKHVFGLFPRHNPLIPRPMPSLSPEGLRVLGSGLLGMGIGYLLAEALEAWSRKGDE